MSASSESALPENPADLAGFGRLEIVAKQLVEGLMMGRHRSPFKGSSVEFVEHREYYPGDEIRHIDWRAFGKTGRYYVKEFEDETNLRAHILMDASGSMAYAGKGVSKFVYGRMLAAAITWLMLCQRDSVGLVTFDSKIREQIKPSSSRDMFRRITQVLENTTPGAETSLAEVIDALLPSIQRRSLLVLISDCFDDLDQLRRVLQKCRHGRHEVLIFRITAPEEEEFPFERPTQFCSLESDPHRMLVDPVRLRREYLRQYQEFSAGLAKECGALGIDSRRLLTNEPLQKTLGNWLAERMERRQPK
jgi:uncharacterized protein (DUF58 family)